LCWDWCKCQPSCWSVWLVSCWSVVFYIKLHLFEPSWSWRGCSNQWRSCMSCIRHT
jgi:hypothetical protein